MTCAPESQMYSMPGAAPAALAADRDERRHDVIAGANSVTPVADFDHHAGAFVAADHRNIAGRPNAFITSLGAAFAVEDVLVGVAQAGRRHLD